MENLSKPLSLLVQVLTREREEITKRSKKERFDWTYCKRVSYQVIDDSLHSLMPHSPNLGVGHLGHDDDIADESGNISIVDLGVRWYSARIMGSQYSDSSSERYAPFWNSSVSLSIILSDCILHLFA